MKFWNLAAQQGWVLGAESGCCYNMCCFYGSHAIYRLLTIITDKADKQTGEKSVFVSVIVVNVKFLIFRGKCAIATAWSSWSSIKNLLKFCQIKYEVSYHFVRAVSLGTTLSRWSQNSMIGELSLLCALILSWQPPAVAPE